MSALRLSKLPAVNTTRSAMGSGRNRKTECHTLGHQQYAGNFQQGAKCRPWLSTRMMESFVHRCLRNWELMEDRCRESLLFVGDDGKILAGFDAGRPELIPARRMTMFRPPPEILTRPADELDQWIQACRGEEPSRANFALILPFCETIYLGNVTLRTPGKLAWDSKRKEFLNSSGANALLKRQVYRKGWEL